MSAPLVLTLLLTMLAAALFSWLAVERHLAFQSHAFDLGNMDQAVWNTLHGRPLGFTDMAVGHAVLTNRLAIHVEPLLLLLAPLYLIHAGPETLLVVQAVVVALGAPAAYLLARDATGNRWAALVFPLAYVLHPSLQNALLDDFHAVTLSACFLLWALYFANRGNVAAFLPFALLAAATKEEVSLSVALLGLLLVVRAHRAAGLLTAFLGVIWFALCVVVIIPHFNPAGHSPFVARYAYLGHGMGGVVTGVLRHPGLVLGTLTSTTRLLYLDDILHPLGFTSLLALPVLLLALPDLLINMLSADPRMYSGFYQYSTPVLPMAVGASALGAGMLRRVAERHGARPGSLVTVVAVFVLVASVVDSYQYGFSPLAVGFVTPSAGVHQALEDSILRAVPATAVVAAADEVEPHLSDRRWVYLLPTVHPRNGPQAAYLALDASVPSAPIEPHTLRHSAANALAHGYGIQRAEDGILLLRRGASRRKLPASFFRFIYAAGTHVQPSGASWGPLRLTGFVVHPRDGAVNRSRPAIGVETYWRATRRLPSRLRITVYLSPVYSGAHPPFSRRWQYQSDSPTLDWLPPVGWPVGRTVRAAFVPLVPPPGSSGRVDVAIGVDGIASLSAPPSQRIPGAPDLLRVGVIAVSG